MGAVIYRLMFIMSEVVSTLFSIIDEVYGDSDWTTLRQEAPGWQCTIPLNPETLNPKPLI